MSTIPKAPEGYNTIMPFVITKDATKVIQFLKDVFFAVEQPYSLTYDTDGLVLHCELMIGNSMVAVADTKPDWPYTPSLLQVYVNDVESTLAKAESLGAVVITKPTDFLGYKFSRIKDAWGNMWWVYQHMEDLKWDESSSDTSEQSWEPTPESEYIHSTLLEAMKNLGK